MEEFFKSVGYALKGIKIATSERNFFIQEIIGVIAIVLSFVLAIPFTQKIIIILCTGLVLGSEVMNSAIERFLDFISPEYHDEIAAIKDLAAGAVLIFSIIALLVGVLIFGSALFPH